jgi:hypothetical protein
MIEEAGRGGKSREFGGKGGGEGFFLDKQGEKRQFLTERKKGEGAVGLFYFLHKSCVGCNLWVDGGKKGTFHGL